MPARSGRRCCARRWRGELGLESYDRLFPSQDFITKKGYGNLVALPLQGRCRKGRHTTVFVDPQSWQRYADQFAYLSTIQRLSRQDVIDTVERLQPPTVGPATRLRRSPLAGEPPAPAVVKAELAGMLAIRRAGLPPSLLASLKHLASLPNAEFYDKQRMGLSVWQTPRFLRCYIETLEHIYLPRGVVAQARSLVEEAGSRLEIVDARPTPGRVELSFVGTLRDEAQRRAVAAMHRHELGVLVAPPGVGKTVMACALIAHHGVPTLVLVEKTPLLQQWRQRLQDFLGLPTDHIGQIGAGTVRPSGVVDLAMLQTLVQRDDLGDLLTAYGLVVVDECHHVAADTFAQVVRDIPARRWLGLTATPKRTDHREEIMVMQCGPVRHRINADNGLTKHLYIHPTEFSLREDIGEETAGILKSIIEPALVADTTRNQQICGDVCGAVAQGRNCLVLTGRTVHVDYLGSQLRSRGLDPVVLHGSQRPAQRLAALDRLADTAVGGPLLVVATDRYIGEGFDCPRLDTVFLTYPVSSETPITQYVGRVMRAHAGKSSVHVHDYADTKVAMLTRMHGKRLTVYRKLGFMVRETPPPGTMDLFSTVDDAG